MPGVAVAVTLVGGASVPVNALPAPAPDVVQKARATPAAVSRTTVVPSKRSKRLRIMVQLPCPEPEYASVSVAPLQPSWFSAVLSMDTFGRAEMLTPRLDSDALPLPGTVSG